MFRVYSIKTCRVRKVWINKYRGMKNTVSCSKIWCIFMSMLFLGLWDHVTKEQQKPQSCVYFESSVWLSVTLQFSCPICWLVLLWPFTYIWKHLSQIRHYSVWLSSTLVVQWSQVYPVTTDWFLSFHKWKKKRSCTYRTQVAVALLVNILRVQFCSFKCWG